MKAMKQVVPGLDLPVSYLSNSRGLDVEGAVAPIGNTGYHPPEVAGTNRYSPPVPFYRTFDGLCVIRWHATLRERFRYLWGDFSEGAVVPHDGPIWDRAHMLEGLTRKFFRMFYGDDELTQHVRHIHFVTESKWGIIPFVFSGNLWQIASLKGGGFNFGETTTACPVSVRKEKVSHDAAPRSWMRVWMAGKDQVPAGGLAEVAEICRYKGKYSIVGLENLGTYDTDDDAIRAFAAIVRQRNKGKWSSAHDAMSLSGGEYPVERCPECECQLLRKSFRQPSDEWDTVALDDLWCGKCSKFVAVPGWRSRATSGLSDFFDRILKKL